MSELSATYTGPEPKSATQINGIIDELRTLYPDAKYDLNFTTPFELLVATILAAQCTDVRVNKVTETLFQKYRSPEDFVAADQEVLEEELKPTGFYKNKTKSVRAASEYLITHYGSKVPQTLAELVKVPGIGRKTANVILGNAFGISEGFIVDTHVGRLVRRFGWSTSEDAVQVESEVMRMVPQQEWLNLAHRLIYHGRQVCVARKPRCAGCTLAALCPSATTNA